MRPSPTTRFMKPTQLRQEAVILGSADNNASSLARGIFSEFKNISINIQVNTNEQILVL
ncbi:hypothetical protein ME793_08850 [Lactobacillus delbrueckii]|nr:hypothetical protein ME793_08850 [Lactobacillus delbrueckii]GHN40114.1 hypothetical protein ME795_13960 [Lactobacillus delbrueckii]